MKKLCKTIFLLALTLGLAAGLFACGPKDKDKDKNNNGGETKITLTFDSNSAYFTSQKKLLPIAGEAPAEGDVYEQAAITLKADPAAKVRLLLKFSEGQTAVSGLKIAVDGGVAQDFVNNAVLFVSAGEITTQELSVAVFLSSTASASVQGSVVAFYFEMSAWQ